MGSQERTRNYLELVVQAKNAYTIASLIVVHYDHVDLMHDQSKPVQCSDTIVLLTRVVLCS